MASEYERMRLANIARNNAVLASLGLAPPSSGSAGYVARRRRPLRLRKKKVPAPRRPLRRSERFVSAARSDTVPSGRGQSSPAIVASVSKKRVSIPETDELKQRSSTLNARKPRKRVLPGTIDDLRPYEKDAFLALREWKRARAKELGYNDPCIVCHNRTLIEMCRQVPDDLDALLDIWGIGQRRLRMHGELMLRALEPWRGHLQKAHADVEANDCSTKRARMTDSDEYASKDWLDKKDRLDLPTGPWADRRGWCAQENGCSACLRHGPDGKWAVLSQRVLDALVERHGGREAGWRWYARPTGSAHLHAWWPPQAVCEAEELTARRLPIGTRSALELVSRLDESVNASG